MLSGTVVSAGSYVLIDNPVHTHRRVGSCNGRGPRTANWFADYLAQQQDTTMQSLILEGGIKGWAAAGPEYTELMDEYDASVWTKK